MTMAELLVDQLRRTRGWTLQLLEGMEGDDWTYQPQPGLSHALWLCGHLASAQDLLVLQRCLGATRLDPAFRAHFPTGAAVKSAGEHDWPSPATVLKTMGEIQQAVETAVGGMSDALLAEPAFGKDGAKHPYYDTKLGAINHAARHEAFHAGQLATLRRLRGKPFLR